MNKIIATKQSGKPVEKRKGDSKFCNIQNNYISIAECDKIIGLEFPLTVEKCLLCRPDHDAFRKIEKAKNKVIECGLKISSFDEKTTLMAVQQIVLRGADALKVKGKTLGDAMIAGQSALTETTPYLALNIELNDFFNEVFTDNDYDLNEIELFNKLIAKLAEFSYKACKLNSKTADVQFLDTKLKKIINALEWQG